MDGVCPLQLAPVVRVGAAAWKLVGVVAIELRELHQGVVAVVVPVAGDLLEQAPADDLVALFLRRGPPGRLHSGEGLLEPGDRLLSPFPADLDPGRRQRRHEQGSGAGLDRLRQRLDEGQVGVERARRQTVGLVDLAEIGDPLVDEDEAGRVFPEDAFEDVRPRRDATGVVLGNQVEGIRAAQLPRQLTPCGADPAPTLRADHVLRATRRADHHRPAHPRRHRRAVFGQELVEARQVSRRRPSRHVVEGEHGVGLAAAEVGLKLHHRIAPRAGEPAGGTDEERAQAVGQVGASEELPGITVLRRCAAGMDLAEVGRELGLLERAGRDVLVRLHDLAPGLEATGGIDGDLQPPGPAALLVAAKLRELGAENGVAHPAELLRGGAGANRLHQATHGIERPLGIVVGERLVVGEPIPDRDQLVDDGTLGSAQHRLEGIGPEPVHRVEQRRLVPGDSTVAVGTEPRQLLRDARPASAR